MKQKDKNSKFKQIPVFRYSEGVFSRGVWKSGHRYLFCLRSSWEMSSLILIGLSPSLTEFLDSPSSMPIPNHFLPSQHQRHPPFKRFGQKSSPTPCSYKKFQPPEPRWEFDRKYKNQPNCNWKTFHVNIFIIHQEYWIGVILTQTARWRQSLGSPQKSPRLKH